MKVDISTHEAADQLLQDENASWSRPAAFAIAEYYEELQEDCDPEIEFCWVTIRIEWCEWETIQEAADCYGLTVEQDHTDEYCLEWFQERTTVLLTDGDAVVIHEF